MRTRSLACKMKKAHEQVTAGFAGTPGLPCAMVLTVSFGLSLVTGLFCHHRSADTCPRNLTPASGRRDHTTSPSASAPLVLRCQGVHRIPRPTFVTIAKRPSYRARDGRNVRWTGRDSQARAPAAD